MTSIRRPQQQQQQQQPGNKKTKRALSRCLVLGFLVSFALSLLIGSHRIKAIKRRTAESARGVEEDVGGAAVQTVRALSLL
mmetsp:Transcript_12795/g.26048  ORF Transcript_12795/g.26048 Transcript_12795/m.26048 type:complete len:81 (-) Transcript_12795:196-438(-)